MPLQLANQSRITRPPKFFPEARNFRLPVRLYGHDELCPDDRDRDSNPRPRWPRKRPPGASKQYLGGDGGAGGDEPGRARGRRGAPRARRRRGRRRGVRDPVRALRAAGLQPGGARLRLRRRCRRRGPGGVPQRDAAAGRDRARARARLWLLPLHRDPQRDLRLDAAPAAGAAERCDPRVGDAARRRSRRSRARPRRPRGRPRPQAVARRPAGGGARGERAPARAPARGARPARAGGDVLRRDRRGDGHEPQLGRPVDLAGADQPARRAARHGAGFGCHLLARVRAGATADRRPRRRPARPRIGRRRLARLAPVELRDLPGRDRGDARRPASPTAPGCRSRSRPGCSRKRWRRRRS